MRKSLLGFSYRSRENDSRNIQLVSCQLLFALLGTFSFVLVLCPTLLGIKRGEGCNAISVFN